jgi:membrane-bound metal-dependent hydrolase YbcI (DUF457 family)
MIIGHYGVSFVLKALHRRLPLWHFIVAAELLDILHSSLVVVGVEKAAVVPGITALVPMDLIYYPYTHSLVAAILWSAATFLLYRLTSIGGAADDRARAAALMGIGVFSHFVLDWVTHRPDLPLLGEGTKVGLGLWNYLVPAYLVETIVLYGGLALYLRRSRGDGFAGRYGMVILCLLGSALLAGFPLGILPRDIKAAETFALFMYAFVVAGSWWSDRDRRALVVT